MIYEDYQTETERQLIKFRETQSKVVGISTDKARAIIARAELPSRIVSMDGINYIVTRDFIPWRVNLTVVKNIVTKVTGG